MRENENIVYAINSIRPGAGFTVADTYESLIWDGGQEQVKPTEKEFNDAVTAWNAEYDTQEYARNRAEQYPDLAEQLDLLWHAIDTGTLDNRDHRNKFYTRLKKVKEDNPKG